MSPVYEYTCTKCGWVTDRKQATFGPLEETDCENCGAKAKFRMSTSPFVWKGNFYTPRHMRSGFQGYTEEERRRNGITEEMEQSRQENKREV